MARAFALAAIALGIGAAGYVVAEPGVDVRFHAAGQLTSDTQGVRSLELRLRMLASLGYSGDVVSGSVRCSTRPGQLPCPAATGRIEIQDARFVAGPPPNFLYPGTVSFGDGSACSLVGSMPLGLDFMAAFKAPISPPFVMLGTYECTRSGATFDRGSFRLWEWGQSRFAREKPK